MGIENSLIHTPPHVSGGWRHCNAGRRKDRAGRDERRFAPHSPDRIDFSLERGTIEGLFGFIDNLRGCAVGRQRHSIARVNICPSASIWRVVQGEVLSLGHDTQKKAPASKVADTGVDKDRKTGDRQMGSALRSVYQKTVDEPVPDEFLALLGKLD